jgi:hypothetical protein
MRTRGHCRVAGDQVAGEQGIRILRGGSYRVQRVAYGGFRVRHRLRRDKSGVAVGGDGASWGFFFVDFENATYR